MLKTLSKKRISKNSLESDILWVHGPLRDLTSRHIQKSAPGWRTERAMIRVLKMRLFNVNFRCFRALATDVETVGGILDADALQVVIFNLSIDVIDRDVGDAGR